MNKSDPEHDEPMLHAKLAKRRFYEELERRVKHFHPTHFIPAIVSFMRHLQRTQHYVYAPNYQIALAIEANCAYFRGHASRSLTWRDYKKLKNVFSGQEQPDVEQILKRDFGIFMLIMHRQQIELQKLIGKVDLSRYYRLFVKDSPLAVSGSHLKEQFGLTPEDWLKAALAVYASADNHPQRTVRKEIEDPQINLDSHALSDFVSLSSYTPHQIGERFKRLRTSVSPEYHESIRPAFLERPIVDLEDGCISIPFPNIAVHSSMTRLHSLMMDMPHFGREFGQRVERYVEQVARCFTHAKLIIGAFVKSPDQATKGPLCARQRGFWAGSRTFYERPIITEHEMKKYSTGQHCDLLIEFPTYIVIIEAKSTIFSRDIINETTIPTDNSTRKITQGIKQLYYTAHDIHSGMFNSLRVTSTKQVCGIVATFGEIPFVNSPWYFDRYLAPSVRGELDPPVFPNNSMQDWPIVLSLEGIEQLVMALHAKGTTLPELRAEKNRLNYAETGDWDTYLSNLLSQEDEPIRTLTHVEDDYEALFRSIDAG